MHMKQREDKPAAGAGNEAFGSVAGLRQVASAYIAACLFWLVNIVCCACLSSLHSFSPSECLVHSRQTDSD